MAIATSYLDQFEEHLSGEEACRLVSPSPRLQGDAAQVGAVGHAGGVLLTAAAEATGLARALREALAPWRKPTAVHNPAKVFLDLAVAVALGGDALADAAIVRGEPGVYGLVASEATISRTIAALAKDAGMVERAVTAARRAARAVAWERAGERAPNRQASAANPLIVDIDATIVIAHSEKEGCGADVQEDLRVPPAGGVPRPRPRRGGGPLTMLLRKGNAGSNTAEDHITVARAAVRALPGIDASRPGSVRRTVFLAFIF